MNRIRQYYPRIAAHREEAALTDLQFIECLARLDWPRPPNRSWTEFQRASHAVWNMRQRAEKVLGINEC